MPKKRALIELFVLSVLSLYLELLIIRWLAQDFRVFCVFKTFPLVTCFVGLGVGFALGKDKYFGLTPMALLFFLAVSRVADWVGFSTIIFPSIGYFQWQQLENLSTSLGLLHIAIVMVMLIVLLAGPFAVMVAIGSRLGLLFNELKPLDAYCVNIGGAILGTLLFTACSFLGMPPYLQLMTAVIPLFFTLPASSRRNRVASALALIACLALSAWLPQVRTSFVAKGQEVYWSPYQRLDLSVLPALVTADGKTLSDVTGYHIGANRYGYQDALNVSQATVQHAQGAVGDSANLITQAAHHYNVPYFLKNAPKDVLVLGAGSGNDVASALRAGAEHIDAIDIDPVIMSIGKRLHPEQPYSSNKVTAICDDARHYLRQCQKKYDLINFAGLDSFTIVGQGGSVTLCNYVYTKESLEQALKLLKPDGLLVLTFYKCNDWLSKRLYLTLQAAAGYPPLVTSDHSSPRWRWEVYLTGPEVQQNKVSLPAAAFPFANDPPPSGPNQRVMTDDWPFIFITPAVFDWPYLLVVTEILLLSLFAGRKLLLAKSETRSWQLFFMGGAFMLLELQAVARLSLLYGATWLTSAVVILGILVMILCANFVIIKTGPNINQHLLYALLCLSVLTSYFLPVNAVLVWGVSFGNIGYLIATLFTILPMALAGMIFSCAFARTVNSAQALAFNLFGAVVGAMLEPLSTQLGINAMALVAGALYVASYACLVSSKPTEQPLTG